MVGLYFLVGIVYVFVNGAFRGIYDDEDWQLPFAHIFLWPVCFICLILARFQRFKNKNWKI
jgi:hypothetical protein